MREEESELDSDEMHRAVPEHLEEALVGKSLHMADVMWKIYQASKTDYNVLVLGETGTGKQIAAKQIHNLSRRKKNRFVHVSCPTIPDDKFESEVFGAKGGVFTGVPKDVEGKVSAARGGTLFLDEIGRLPSNIQSKLLRLAESKRFYRLGDSKESECDFKLICATNKPLDEMTGHERAEGGESDERSGEPFAFDLYQRIAEHKIKILPLRERQEDILPIFIHLVRKYHPTLTPSEYWLTLSDLMHLVLWKWRGNVREIERRIKKFEVKRDSASPLANICYEEFEEFESVWQEHNLPDQDERWWSIPVNAIDLQKEWEKADVAHRLTELMVPFEPKKLVELLVKCRSLQIDAVYDKSIRDKAWRELAKAEHAEREQDEHIDSDSSESQSTMLQEHPSEELTLSSLARVPESLGTVRQLYLKEVLKHYPVESGKRGESPEWLAGKLGISPTTLKKYIKEYRLDEQSGPQSPENEDNSPTA